jgi:hypothetical protein
MWITLCFCSMYLDVCNCAIEHNVASCLTTLGTMDHGGMQCAKTQMGAVDLYGGW